jgi:hypothetical protein
MKLTKKLSTLLLTATLVVSASITAFAAPNDDTITALKNAKLPTTYIIQAENYLKTRTLTADESTAVITQVTKAVDLLKASGKKDISLLSADDKSKIISYVTAAGDAIDLTISITKQSNGEFLIVTKDKDSKTVATFTSNEIKQTGLDNTIIFTGALMIILAAGSVFVLRKTA